MTNDINKEVYEKIVDTLVEDFQKDRDEIKPDTTLKDELNLDSLDRVDLVVALESAYDVEISEGSDDTVKKQFYQCKTVQEIADFLTELVIKAKENK
jgi:acyl carrier protein